ncbi:ABC transporter ATP-binding protein [Vineibacter terrae]|uniref:ABC transporter ATP-binding protein n=1 Tax=Vineibacter terrae TaxID=2586908 RepID=A0A5C8PJX9_9HYPH|nr:ABC transporter ATP-binding protein [Vineibacter terrae]TXL73932.1 ABC transporter ATP-binding protein [Vineibacter terrae]
MSQPLLRVENLRTHLFLKRGVVKAVDGVNLHVDAGETLGLVGESGSGKSMTSLSILRLLPRQSGRIVEGHIWVDGVDLASLSEEEMARDWRGRRVSMVSQDPMTSLNPVFTVGDQVGAPFRYHGLAHGARAVREAAVKVLRRVRIPSPEKRLDDYPHQFSGGMRQRVVAAMAIACAPRLLIADEPTSNLDVTIQVQMIALFRELQRDSGLGIILITHDLGVAASICQRVAVMYAGRIVEVGDVRTIYRSPAHPYTQALLNAIPHLGQRRRRLHAIAGQPPSLIDPPVGCRFAARCSRRTAQCDAEYPPEVELASGHKVACWRPGPEAA